MQHPSRCIARAKVKYSKSCFLFQASQRIPLHTRSVPFARADAIARLSFFISSACTLVLVARTVRLSCSPRRQMPAPCSAWQHLNTSSGSIGSKNAEHIRQVLGGNTALQVSEPSNVFFAAHLGLHACARVPIRCFPSVATLKRQLESQHT